MTYSFHRTSSMFFLLLIYLSLSISSYSMKFATVDQICSKHSNPSFCQGFLINMVGGAEPANLTTVGLSTINTAHVSAFNALTLIHNLIGRTGDGPLKQHYVSCSEHYNGALISINEAKTSLSGGDYKGSHDAAVAVVNDVDACDSQPPSDPSELPKNNKNTVDTTNIVAIIADLLAQN